MKCCYQCSSTDAWNKVAFDRIVYPQVFEVPAHNIGEAVKASGAVDLSTFGATLSILGLWKVPHGL